MRSRPIDLPALSAATNHNGGALHFGTDGRLYVGVGGALYVLTRTCIMRIGVP